MENKVYIITRIEGEYAYLQEASMCSASEELLIAMALLPLGVDLGDKVIYNDMEFSLWA